MKTQTKVYGKIEYRIKDLKPVQAKDIWGNDKNLEDKDNNLYLIKSTTEAV